MTLEDFINEKLCPTGTVTAWDETVIRTALDLGDMDTLICQILNISERAGIPVPTDLILPGAEQ
ncbi:hypothetical protein A3BBH6_06660 [Alistipes onderdonkii subsp. vulgaris]|uniref:hypothetical protein n=1 Tax=Alistipes onderdonkii TaxID=328813 RepID=UPI001144AB44|nr:hypothetical protein [Alistipes onderdonkii]BBL00430.1 hypothetical protein A3BBH6_06660 [Alistipes onderdonkii subsp. vulgaris]